MKRIIAILVLITLAAGTTAFASNADKLLDSYYGTNAVVGHKYDDMEQAPWASEAVAYLVGRGILNPVDRLYPQSNITRDEFMKILVLAFGVYDSEATSDFDDVPSDSWQYPYVSSAKKLNITSGISATEFGANELIAREQLITLAYRAAEICGISMEEEVGEVFDDYDEISDYARKAVAVFKNSGILSGDENNRFNPKNNASRAEAVKIIYELLQKT